MTSKETEHFSPVLAFLLSLIIPGAGHVYRGKWGQGFGWGLYVLAAYIVSGLLALISPLFLGIALLVHLHCAVNASARQRDGNTETPNAIRGWQCPRCRTETPDALQRCRGCGEPRAGTSVE